MPIQNHDRQISVSSQSVLLITFNKSLLHAANFERVKTAHSLLPSNPAGLGPPCDCWRAVNSLRFLATGNSHARSLLARLGSQSRSIAGIEYLRWRTHVIFFGKGPYSAASRLRTHHLSGSETLNSQFSPA